jgi:hypothetical protein
MSTEGNYLYGFINRPLPAEPALVGLAGAPVHTLTYGDISAVVSRHPVRRLMPSRSNLEPHHRIVRQISSACTLVPAAFGHISETDQDLVAVLRGNYDDIRTELARLDGKCEMGLKVSWTVDNIFNYFVRTNRELRELRDRVFRDREPSVAAKLQVGGLFEAALARERERLSRGVMTAFSAVAREVSYTPPRTESVVFQCAMLIERDGGPEFEAALRRAAALLNQNFTLEYNGPWPAYSFVRLRLQSPAGATVA